MSEQNPSPTPAAPSAEPAATPTGTATNGSGIAQRVDVGTMTDSHTNIVGEAPGAMFIGQYIEMARETKTVVRRFSCSDGVALSETEEQASVKHYQGSDGEVETLMTHLTERRVLLLSAERGAGKVAAAVYLGMQLRQERRCTHATVLADALDRQVRIDVRHLAERDKGLPGRVVVFRKPFGRADPELARLFEKTDRAGWEQLTARLRQQNAYLIFTADPEDAAPIRDRAAAQGLLRELAPHPAPLLEGALDGKLREMEEAGVAPEPLSVLRAGRETLLEMFRFTSSVAEFADFYVEHYRPDLRLDEAVDRFRDTSAWLLQELERDFEFWTFAFALVLAQSVRDAQGVAWLDFDRLHRRVRQWLRRDLNQRSAAAEADDADDAESHPSLSEEPLLRRCRATIVKDSSSGADMIQFTDGRALRELWKVIMARHRRALTTILPGLRDLAESGQDDQRSLRVLAAQILGRIGEVDPRRIVFPLVDRWVRSEKGRHHGAIGPLYEGVLGSANEHYRALCFRHLRQARWNAVPGQAGLKAVIGAYSWIGDYELGLAMRELGEIAREHLAPVIGDVQQLARWLGELETACLSRAQVGQDLDTLLVCHALLRDLMEKVFKENGPTLPGMQASLVSLCLTTGPMPVFRELRRWVAEGGWKTGVLVGLMFLHEDGIANALKAGKVEVGTPVDGRGTWCNPLVTAVAAGDDEVRQTARFLGDLYESLSTPHLVDSKLLRYGRDSLQGHLLDWMRDALQIPEYAGSMRSLFEAVAQTHEGILRPSLIQLLARRELREADDPRLRAFAASIQL